MIIPVAECYIPFLIDTAADVDDLKDGVFTINGDTTMPILNTGFMSAKGWRGKIRFNPCRIPTYIREYDHALSSNLLEGRGTQSGAHVDIMGNFALIKNIMWIVVGANEEGLGSDLVLSDIFKWSKKIELPL